MRPQRDLTLPRRPFGTSGPVGDDSLKTNWRRVASLSGDRSAFAGDVVIDYD